MATPNKKNKDRWIISSFGVAALTLLLSGAGQLSAHDTRLTALEQSEQVRKIDHDVLIRMNERQEAMMEKLEQMDQKLDGLSGEDE